VEAGGGLDDPLAGDATGIILAATVTALLGLPIWLDLIVEYMAGFAFGLFIFFQSLFMKSMMAARTGRTCAGVSCRSSSA
jgi:hypothetical protein